MHISFDIIRLPSILNTIE